MAISMTGDIPGMTQQQYEGALKDVMPKMKAARGFIAHTGAPIPGGWQVHEIWESQEAWEKFYREAILPLMVGVPVVQQQVNTIRPLHTVITR